MRQACFQRGRGSSAGGFDQRRAKLSLGENDHKQRLDIALWADQQALVVKEVPLKASVMEVKDLAR